MITLADLRGMKHKDVIEHLATTYSGTESGFDYGDISDKDIKAAKEKLVNMKVLIAYEHVGSWGCDSSSFFLLRNKKTNVLYEVHGSHCSCYGFEGQLDLEETCKKALLARCDNPYSLFCAGGYDEEEDDNHQAVIDYVRKVLV